MQKKKAFTLVELLVAMAIIGILIGLSLFGIAAAQRNARDVARRAAAEDINAGIADYLNLTQAFPRSIKFEDDSVIISPTLAQSKANCTAADKCVLIPLKGAAVIDGPVASGGSSGVLLAGNTTSTDSSQWCFESQTDGYSLAVRLENGDVHQAGTSTTTCEPRSN
ncbi:MAG: type II secretion system protein [Candidatus Dojkabacteria bacterium]|uniref:Type II secretion system protein n=1 Tax=Candidatus Dojkabacteria bacterium TaxID=2099670 RepID=A0A952DUL5_9BACT|nr:type II secretion system protein [Candidatus Dojkabacteria bacterium]WKZ28340.1 MAG: type II secretion system protein [Candidatus Dojkabacteria bacterium]